MSDQEQIRRRFKTQLDGYLQAYNIASDLHPLDQIAQLPKEIIFRLSHLSIAEDNPESASAFEECVNSHEPITTRSGQALHMCALDKRRVTDGVIRRMIDKWLKAGVLEDGLLHHATEGSPLMNLLI
jgi:hypothetical protein